LLMRGNAENRSACARRILVLSVAGSPSRDHDPPAGGE